VETGNLQRRIVSELPDIKLYPDEPMTRHTTFKIGGPAELLAVPPDTESLGRLLSLCQEEGVVPFVIGNGSNLLVSDAGIAGVVIRTTALSEIRAVSGEVIEASCGALLSKTAAFALKQGLTGLEFAAGIPGSVGGAVFMNAGAYGGQMADVVTDSVCLDRGGQESLISGSEHRFGYRKSLFSEEPDKIVLSTRIRLKKGDAESIRARMETLRDKRYASQPLDMPSAGSVFKRPEGFYAGTMIDQAGLKGASVGGAQVSVKHAGFIVNMGGATCADVLNLITLIQEKVFREFGVTLEPEIRVVGRKEG